MGKNGKEKLPALNGWEKQQNLKDCVFTYRLEYLVQTDLANMTFIGQKLSLLGSLWTELCKSFFLPLMVLFLIISETIVIGHYKVRLTWNGRNFISKILMDEWRKGNLGTNWHLTYSENTCTPSSIQETFISKISFVLKM
jgi:hypothetical protein